MVDVVVEDFGGEKIQMPGFAIDAPISQQQDVHTMY